MILTLSNFLEKPETPFIRNPSKRPKNSNLLNTHLIWKWEFAPYCKIRSLRSQCQYFWISTNFATFLIKKYHFKYSHLGIDMKRLDEIRTVMHMRIFWRSIGSPKWDFFWKIVKKPLTDFSSILLSYMNFPANFTLLI